MELTLFRLGARLNPSLFSNVVHSYSKRSLSTSLVHSAPEGSKDRLKDEEPFKNYAKASESLEHFASRTKPVYENYTLPHPIWSADEVKSVQITHRKPEGVSDTLAYYAVKTLRTGFDIVSGYTVKKRLGTLDERSVLIRAIFLETVAGVPGFAAGMIRHLHSLRQMRRDHGWIHTLLEEAENERMHLLTFLELRRPGPVFRFAVIFTQWTFTAAFSLAYFINPLFCHRFVGYLEEQAVVTYTEILEKIDAGHLPMWKTLPAPLIAVKYWKLDEDAKMREVILAIRADEAHHRQVNHTLGDLDHNQDNPFRPGE